jgi:hypothetical protein
VGVSADKTYGYYSALESFAGTGIAELYWTVSEDWEPILTVANFADASDRVTVALTYNGGSYVLPEIPMVPLQSDTIDVRELLASGQPDRDGHVIPPDVQFGGYRITGAGHSSALLVKEYLISHVQQISAPFYGSQRYVVSYTLSPDPVVVLVGGTTTVDGQLEWSDATYQEYYCTGMTVANTSILTLSGLGCPKTVTGVSRGTTSISARSNGLVIDQYGDIGQLNSNTVQANSQAPDHLVVHSGVTQSQSCPAGQTGLIRTITYDIVDVAGTRLTVIITNREHFSSKDPSNGTSSCDPTRAVGTSETCGASPAGIIADQLAAGCGSTTCGSLLSQLALPESTITVTPAGTQGGEQVEPLVAWIGFWHRTNTKLGRLNHERIL